MSEHDSDANGTERCLHCCGSGEEPFSDDEKCSICLGETAVPEQINREYYDAIQEVLDDV